MYLNPYYIFTISRLLGLVVRPIFLAFLISIDQKLFSNNYVLILAYAQLTLAFFNSEAHRRFYKVIFFGSTETFKKVKETLIYWRTCTSHVCIVALPLWFVLLFLVDDWGLASLVMFIGLLDKVFDEYQRFYIYNVDYFRWAKIFGIKSILPIFLCISYWLIFEELNIVVYFTTYVASMFLVFRYVDGFSARMCKFSLRFYRQFGSYRYPSLLIYTFSVSCILVVDKLIVSRLLFDELAPYVLLCNLAVMSVIFYDYIFLTKMKPKLVNYDPLVDGPLISFKNALYAVGPLIGLGIFILMFARQYLSDYDFRLDLLPYVFSVYGIYNLTSLFSLFAYWNRSFRKLALIEVSLLFGLLAFCMIPNEIYGVLNLLIIYHGLRFIFYYLVVNYD